MYLAFQTLPFVKILSMLVLLPDFPGAGQKMVHGFSKSVI